MVIRIRPISRRTAPTTSSTTDIIRTALRSRGSGRPPPSRRTTAAPGPPRRRSSRARRGSTTTVPAGRPAVEHRGGQPHGTADTQGDEDVPDLPDGGVGERLPDVPAGHRQYRT